MMVIIEINIINEEGRARNRAKERKRDGGFFKVCSRPVIVFILWHFPYSGRNIHQHEQKVNNDII